MRSFKDNAGREWHLAINVNVARSVRDRAEFDLLKLDIPRLQGDPILLVDVLWLVCERQAADLGVNQEQFAAGLVGDPIDPATTALLEAIADFFPSARRGLILQALGKVKSAEQAMVPALAAELDKIDVQAELTRILAGAGRSPGPTSSSSPASSASTQADSASAS